MTTTTTFQISPNFILREEPQYFDSYMVIDVRKNLVYDVDLPTISLLEFLSHNSLCNKCIQQYLEVNKANFHIQELISRRFIEENQLQCNHVLPVVMHKKNWVESIPLEERKIMYLSSPTDVVLVITRRCDLACVHCNVTASTLQPPDLIPVDQWKAVLDQLERMRVIRVTISGGEPTVYRDFNELFDYFGKKKFIKIMLTNGMNITDEIAKYMGETNIMPTVSLDGAIASVHDEFRKYKGSFNRCIESLDRLDKYGVAYNICSVLHKKNISHIRDLMNIAFEYGAKQLILQPLKPIGRGLSAHEWFLDQSTYDNLSNLTQPLLKEFPGLKIILSEYDDFENLGPPAKKGYGRSVDTIYGATSCQAGTYGMAIDHDGLVYPCLLGQNLRLNPIGNILEQSLDEVWKSNKWNIFRNQKFTGCRINRLNDLRKEGKPYKNLPMLT